MIVMPSNSSGWFWHTLARETGRLGHLYSPGAQRGPWPWFPYALDNGAYSCWDRDANAFDEKRWLVTEGRLNKLYFWAQSANTKPMWAIVPDVPGNAARTIDKWRALAVYQPFPLAMAVQDGMTPADVKKLKIQPEVIAIGGTDEFKWSTVRLWVQAFPRVHLLRCNSPERLWDLDELGIESCDGTGWGQGDRTQTRGLEKWARLAAKPITSDLWPYICREPKNKKQESFT